MEYYAAIKKNEIDLDPLIWKDIGSTVIWGEKSCKTMILFLIIHSFLDTHKEML